MLLDAAHALMHTRSFDGDGLTGECRLDWHALVKRKRTFTDPHPIASERWLASSNVTLLHGHAEMTDDETVSVDGESVRAETVVIATGARPAPLHIPGEDLLVTSDRFMELDHLPDSIVFVGGGYISFEFAALAAAAGSKVTILHRSADVLKGFDPELAAMLVARYRGLGIDVVTGAEVLSLSASGRAVVLDTDQGPISATIAVHGAGRVPDVHRLNLAAAEVEFDDRGVLVDERMRSISNPRIYAAGDAAAAGAALTPIAIRQGRVAAANILGDDQVFDDRGTPSVVFADPALARVGAMADDDPEADVIRTDMSSWFTQRRLGYEHAAAKVVVERSSGRILGAHLLGPKADEIINVFAVAVRHRLTTEQHSDTVWAYPTAGSDIAYML
ncbi:MAG: dihydrolipoyl dehydrogenase family protein [Coriobacteriia bacterium]